MQLTVGQRVSFGNDMNDLGTVIEVRTKFGRGRSAQGGQGGGQFNGGTSYAAYVVRWDGEVLDESVTYRRSELGLVEA